MAHARSRWKFARLLAAALLAPMGLCCESKASPLVTAPLSAPPSDVRVPGFGAGASVLVAPNVGAAVHASPVPPVETDCAPLPSSPIALEPLPSPIGPSAIQDKSGLALVRFYQALSSAVAGKGIARIMYFGDSHVASDAMTGRVRRNLQARFGNAGPGFFMPIKLARWYAHAGIEFQRDSGWSVLSVRKSGPIGRYAGPSGFALQSSGMASARFDLRPGVAEDGAIGGLATTSWASKTTPGSSIAGSRSDAVPAGSGLEVAGSVAAGESGQAARQLASGGARLGLYFLKQPQGGQVMVTFDEQSATVLSTDGSLSAGYAELPVERVPSHVAIDTVGNGVVTLFGVTLERGSRGVVLDVLGIPGARARDHLLWDDVLYREHLIQRDPSLIVLAYGTNEGMDASEPLEQYEQELRQVVSRVRSARPTASCLLIGPTDHPQRVAHERYRERRRTDQIVRAQRRIAVEAGCGFMDLVELTGGPMSMMKLVDARLGARDHTHFTRRGYEALGEAISAALVDGYARWQKNACVPRAASRSDYRRVR